MPDETELVKDQMYYNNINEGISYLKNSNLLIPAFFEAGIESRYNVSFTGTVCRFLDYEKNSPFTMAESLQFECDRTDERSATSASGLGKIYMVFQGTFLGWSRNAGTGWGSTRWPGGGRATSTHEVDYCCMTNMSCGHDELIVVGDKKPLYVVCPTTSEWYPSICVWAAEKGIAVLSDINL